MFKVNILADKVTRLSIVMAACFFASSAVAMLQDAILFSQVLRLASLEPRAEDFEPDTAPCQFKMQGNNQEYVHRSDCDGVCNKSSFFLCLAATGAPVAAARRYTIGDTLMVPRFAVNRQCAQRNQVARDLLSTLAHQAVASSARKIQIFLAPTQREVAVFLYGFGLYALEFNPVNPESIAPEVLEAGSLDLFLERGLWIFEWDLQTPVNVLAQRSIQHKAALSEWRKRLHAMSQVAQIMQDPSVQ